MNKNETVEQHVKFIQNNLNECYEHLHKAKTELSTAFSEIQALQEMLQSLTNSLAILEFKDMLKDSIEEDAQEHAVVFEEDRVIYKDPFRREYKPQDQWKVEQTAYGPPIVDVSDSTKRIISSTTTSASTPFYQDRIGGEWVP